jgi:hypothetical protein
VALNGIQSGHFLDTPEFVPIHDRGNNESIFDRLDWQPNSNDALHLNLFTARNWLQVPNDYDQLAQDQKLRVLTWNIAPGYQHTINAHTLLTVNPFVRRDQFNYYGSRDLFADTPITAAQNRFLTDYGVKADISYVQGRHNVKVGTQIQQTRLLENFQFGHSQSHLPAQPEPAARNRPLRFDARRLTVRFSWFPQHQPVRVLHPG